jgi:hypothetical protein
VESFCVDEWVMICARYVVLEYRYGRVVARRAAAAVYGREGLVDDKAPDWSGPRQPPLRTAIDKGGTTPVWNQGFGADSESLRAQPSTTMSERDDDGAGDRGGGAEWKSIGDGFSVHAGQTPWPSMQAQSRHGRLRSAPAPAVDSQPFVCYAFCSGGQHCHIRVG